MCTDKSLGVWMFQSLRRVSCLAALVLVLWLALPAGSGEAQTPVPATLVQAATPMLPYLDWLIDPSGKLTVEDMAAPAQQAAFRPLNLEKVPRETGTVWLRFTLAPRVLDARATTYLLDMGEGVPGTPTLYIPKHNVLNDTTEWQDFTPSQRSIFLMPDAQTSPVTAYIKMSGLPGLWFAPMLRTPHNAATALERLLRPAVIVMLGVVMLLCLLRSLTERGEWRFWTSLYTGAALLHSVWGVPTVLQGHVPMGEIASVLAPGVALMLLPHVGRHLMHTRDTARIIDVQYILLSLPGAALALLPLVPGFSWTIRYLDLWPLGTLLLVPTTLGAWLMGLAGARRFLLGCLLPPLATAAGIMGIGSNVPAPLLATAPLWGVALSALLIAGTAAAQEYAETDRPADPRLDPLHDPALRIVTPEELAQENAVPMPEPALWEQDALPRTPADSTALAWEEKLRGSLDSLLREAAALSECSLPPAARQYAQAVQETVRSMSTLLLQPLDAQETRGTDSEETGAEPFFDLQQILRNAHDAVASNAENKNIALSWFMPPHLASRYVGDGRRLATCLRLLLESAVRATSRGGVQVAVRRVPESVDAGHLLFSVTDTGTGMPPHDRSSVALARTWELAAANRGFLGVECSPHGASISFTVRLEVASAHSVPEDTQSDTRDGAHDNIYNAAPAKAVANRDNAPDSRSFVASGTDSSEWGGKPVEVPAASSEAAMPVSPQGRTAAGDGVFVAAAQAASKYPVIPRIIIADDSLSNRQLLAFFLEGLPYQTQEARSPDEAVELYFTAPAALIIFDGDMPEEDTLSAAERIRAFEVEHGLPAALMLALTTDESRWDALHAGGFTHALVKPVTRTGLRRTVQELLPAGAVAVPPPLGEELLQPTDASEAQSLLFPEYESEGILLYDQPASESRSVAAVDDDDEIIDTGEPLPDSVASSASSSIADSLPDNAAFSEPLSMSPAQDSADRRASTASEKMPVPLLDMPTDGEGQSARQSDTPTSPATVDSEDSAFVENVYPHPSHAMGAANPESATQGAKPAEDAEKADVVTVRAEMPTFFRPESTPANATHADALLEWVGEPMPVRKIPPLPEDRAESSSADNGSSHSATPASPAPAPSSASDDNSAVSKAAKPVVKVSGRIAPPTLQEPNATARTASGHTSVAPSHAVEWVGEPMPILKASPAVTASAEFASGASSAVSPASSVVPPVAAPEASPELSPEAVSTVSDAPQAGEPPVSEQPVMSGLPTSAAKVWIAPDTPSRVPDLLTPYTRASFAAETEAANALAAAANAAPVQETATATAAHSEFIPLSFEPVSEAVQMPVPPSYTPMAPSVPVTPVQSGGKSSPREASRSERLSLIPEESPLLDFIIAPAQASAVSAVPVGQTSKARLVSPAPQPAPAPIPKVTPASAASVVPVQVATAVGTAAPAPTITVQGTTAPASMAAPASYSPDSPIPTMLEEFDEAMRYARGGFARKNIQAVHEAAVYIANRSDTCGLRVLARMARCVGEAAKAEDMEALNNLLPELETAVERNKIALLKK